MSIPCITSNCSSILPTSVFETVGNTLTTALNVFLTAQCLFVGNSLNECLFDESYPPDSSNNLTDLEFDFIIVGAGSSGSVLANRLSEVPCWKILLIEAGDDPPFQSQVPALWAFTVNSAADWIYLSEKEPGKSEAYRDGRCAIPRGKMLGGSSSLNLMVYLRGNPQDYDNLEAAGNKGWGYADVLPYFKKTENLTQPEVENNPILRKYHGYAGPLNVHPYATYGTQPIIEPILSALREVGSPTVIDLNGPSQYGTARLQSTIHEGRRESAARAYLTPIADRPNLRVWKNSLVSKIVIKGDTAVGVRVILKNDKEVEVRAKREVILSAGSINTPQLLMLSGLGPKEHLTELDIPVIKDLPVGKNLADHPFVPVFVGFANGWPPPSLTAALIEYVTNRTGFFAQNGGAVEIGTFPINVNQSDNQPDLELNQFSFDSGSGLVLERIFGTHFRYVEPLKNSLIDFNRDMPICLFVMNLISAESRGRILLRNKNPKSYPRIYQNFLDSQQDLDIFLLAVDYVTQLVNTKSLRALGATILPVDVPQCNSLDFQSREYWVCMVYNLIMSVYHPHGTAKMGQENDPTTVVDSNLRVHGINNLRVVDASIFPSQISGHLTAPCMMIAEKIADQIKADHKTETPCMA